MPFVKLRDKGTIFSDHTQNVAVSGTKIVKVKNTDKVKDAVRVGILLVVDDKEAKAALAEAEGNDKKAADLRKGEDKKLAEAQAENKKLKEANAKLEEENATLKADAEAKAAKIAEIEADLEKLSKPEEDKKAPAKK